MPNILRLNKISPLAEKILPKTYKLVDECANPDAIIVRSFKMLDYTFPESLLMVARAGAGVNNIPVDKCSEKGVVVFNTPGANANAVKELVICSLFMCGRRKKDFIGGEITGKTLGIVGLGAIGLLVANSALALGMEIIGYDPFLTPEKKAKLDSRIKTVAKLEELYPVCDFISLHVPLADNTREMINENVLATCKKGVNIINCARGELVNNPAIINALASGKVNRYVTDFPDADVLGIDNIITIPHLGASTPEAEDNCAVMAAEEMMDFLDNGNIRNSVNFPNVSLERCNCNCARITVIYKGNLDINAEAVKLGIKVKKFAAAAKKDYGYAIIAAEDAKNADKLKSIAGVLRVRVI
ncbi:formate dehydrogenase 1 [Holotrichia oblita]|nr:formate dehydrogenase 1 [Holotrichia oblita]